MLDIKYIRENVELVKESARKKHIKVDIDRLLEVDEKRRSLLTEGDRLRAKKNRVSQEIANIKGDERQEAIKAMREVAARLKEIDKEEKEVQEDFENLMLLVPQVPSDDVPEGEDENDNVEIRRWGEIPEFNFPVKDHVELGEILDLIDIPRGVKLAGPRSYFLKNEAALLENAVLRFSYDMLIERGFTPMIVPHLVKDIAMMGTAYYPGGEEQAYRTSCDPLSLIGTSEVPLTAYHYDEILKEGGLPVMYAGMSVCYRREAGTYGKDTRGLYRIHQFQKVEQVILCRADEEESTRMHDFILKNSEDLVQALGLPYRVVVVCTGDLGQPQVKKYDIECWMPSREIGWGETHSASKFHDFQARRLKMRYRDNDGNIRYVHTLNNTHVATPRILIPILENYQQKDGSVVIPEVLRTYMGGQEIIEPKG